MNPDLEKLRRFSLTTGVLLISYVVAGFKPKPDVSTPFGNFAIERTDLVPIGLVLASVGGLLRFWYYAPMVRLAPWRRRGDFLRRSKRLSEEENYQFFVETEEKAEQLHAEARSLFPRFLNRPVLSKIQRKTYMKLPSGAFLLT